MAKLLPWDIVLMITNFQRDTDVSLGEFFFWLLFGHGKENMRCESQYRIF
jgi:hypothetical protein